MWNDRVPLANSLMSGLTSEPSSRGSSQYEPSTWKSPVGLEEAYRFCRKKPKSETIWWALTGKIAARKWILQWRHGTLRLCLRTASDGQRGSVRSKTSHMCLAAFSELSWNRNFGCKVLSAEKTAAGEVSLAFSLCKVAGIKALGSRFCNNIQMKKAVQNVWLFSIFWKMWYNILEIKTMKGNVKMNKVDREEMVTYVKELNTYIMLALIFIIYFIGTLIFMIFEIFMEFIFEIKRRVFESFTENAS